MSKTVLQVLIEAKELLSDPKHWTKGKAARNADGISVQARNSHAVCWCALGALDKVRDDIETGWAAQSLLEEFAPYEDVAYLNDASKTTHADIMALFGKAITKARIEEQLHV